MSRITRTDLIVFLVIPIIGISFIIGRMIMDKPLSDGKLFLVVIIYIIIAATTSKR